jgi:hypothetical protein
VLAYLAAWSFVGRPDNGYWGLVIAPLLPLGLLQLPEALRRARLLAASSAPTERATPAESPRFALRARRSRGAPGVVQGIRSAVFCQ